MNPKTPLQAPRRLKFLLGAFALAFAVESVTAQITVLRPKEGDNFASSWKGENIYVHTKAQDAFGGSGDAETWRNMINSGCVFGYSGQKLTRGIDVSEDWQYDFVNPAQMDAWLQGNDPTKTAYPYLNWGQFNVSKPSNVYGGFYLAFRDGKRKGESIFSEDAIAVGDDKIVLYDRDDNTISIYNLTGLLYNDPTWTKFSGSSIYKDMTLEDKIGNMIGYEESNLYFLEGDSHVLSFNSITGAFVKEWMFAFSSDSPLYGCTLGDVVDGRVDGWSYIGWDVGPIIISVDGIAVPEPAEFAAALGALAIGFLTFKRRKK